MANVRAIYEKPLRTLDDLGVELAFFLRALAWTPKTVKLLATAASDPAVDRIFVNPAIKRMLCEGPTRKEPWISRIRPWWGHHDHFHVRLKCPPDSPLCRAQDPVPEWGLMVAEGENYFTTAWWLVTFPGLAILVTALAFTLLGDGLRDTLDPRRLPVR